MREWCGKIVYVTLLIHKRVDMGKRRQSCKRKLTQLYIRHIPFLKIKYGDDTNPYNI